MLNDPTQGRIMKKYLLISALVLISFAINAKVSDHVNLAKEESFYKSITSSFHDRYERTVEYWTPIVNEKIDLTARYVNDKVAPKLRKVYKSYMSGPGKDVGSHIYTSYLYLDKKWTDLIESADNYYQKNHPITYRYFVDTPAFIKKAYESGIISIWQWMYTLDGSELASLSPEKKVSVSMAIAAGQALKENIPSKQSQMLNRLLEDIRGATQDYGMQDCYRIVLMESNVANAFNIGCNIFFDKTMIGILNGDERLIRAVVAHEVSHGERGHGMKTLLALMGSIGKHYAELTMQELLWLATGQAEEMFKTVTKHGNQFDFIMEDFASKAPAVEIDADIHAARLLERAGYSAYDLIDALKELHAVTENMDCDRERIVSNGKRDYPTFCARKDAILNAI